MKKLIFCLLFALAMTTSSFACSNLIVGKAASADSSVFVSYSADSFGAFGSLCHYPAATYPEGAMLDVYEWDTGKFLGQIPQVRQTYNVIGNINEFQVTIGETTFGGREELSDPNGRMDYGSMMYIALQRSKTAREAMKVMIDLANENGYCSGGESFSVADPNEAWIMEVIGKGKDEKGIVWIAVRVPDDCICAHANQSRIHKVNLKDKENVMYAKDMISFAKKMGFFDGKDEDFSFAQAYCPLSFDGLRYCDARVWSFFHKYGAEDMQPYLASAMGDPTATPIPLFVKPKKLMTVQDVQTAMRDHYEDTPFDFTNDLGGGIFGMPYRLSPLEFEVDGKHYFNERPISTFQSAFTFVSQMRASLPNPIGGVLWFGTDDANMVVFTPVYCCTNRVPTCYSPETADAVTFSWNSSFWVFNWVSNMVYPKYSLEIEDLRKVQSEYEQRELAQQKSIEEEALSMMEGGQKYVVDYLTDYSNNCAEEALTAWRELGEFLIVKYNDFVVKPETNGKFKRSKTGQGANVVRPGYPEEYFKKVIEETGDKYLKPNQK